MIASIFLASTLAFSQVDYAQLGTTKDHRIYVEIPSINVVWEDNLDRVVNLTLRMTPNVPSDVMFDGEISINCRTGYSEVKKQRTFNSDGELIDVSLYGGPLEQWKSFTRKSSLELVDYLCQTSDVRRRALKKGNTV